MRALAVAIASSVCAIHARRVGQTIRVWQGNAEAPDLEHVVPSVEQRSPTMADASAEKQAQLVSEELKPTMEDMELQDQVKHAVEHLMALMENRDIQHQANLLAKELLAILKDPTLQDHAKLAARELNTMIEDPEFQEQAKYFAEQMEALMRDLKGPKVQEQTKLAVEVMKATMANPKVSRQAKIFAKRMETMVSNPSVQKHAKLVAERMKIMIANPDFQEYAQLLSARMTAADPKVLAQQQGLIVADLNSQEATLPFNCQNHTLQSSLLQARAQVTDEWHVPAVGQRRNGLGHGIPAPHITKMQPYSSPILSSGLATRPVLPHSFRPARGNRGPVVTMGAPLLPASIAAKDLGVAAGVAAASLGWSLTAGRLVNMSMITPVLGRKLLHVTAAPLFLLSWSLFSDNPSAQWIAATIPALSISRLLGASFGVPSASGLVRAVSRSGNSSEVLGGPLYYSLVLLVATVFGWRSPAAYVAVAQMAAGDGMADIVGRKYGKTKWPFAKGKSIEGSAAFALSGFAVSLGMISFLHATGGATLTIAGAAPALLLISLISAAVELLPGQFVDDNFSVPGIAAVLAKLWLE